MIALNQYEVYIEGLRQEKLNIQNQLEQTHCKVRRYNVCFNMIGSKKSITFYTIRPLSQSST